MNEEILACFEEALGDQLPEMGTDAAAGREANAEGAEAVRRLEAAAEQQREHSLLAPAAGRGVEPVLPDPTNSGGAPPPPPPGGRQIFAFIRYSSDSIFFFEAIFSDFQREYKEYLRI